MIISRTIFIVCTLGEPEALETIFSILGQCSDQLKVVLHSKLSFYDSLPTVVKSANIVFSEDRKLQGIYPAMNDALAFVYNNKGFDDYDYFSFVNAGDILEAGFMRTALLDQGIQVQVHKSEPHVVIFGHSSFLVTRTSRNVRLKTYYPPLKYTWHDVYRGGSFCHQAAYFPLRACRELGLYFDPSLFPFSDLAFLVELLKVNISVETSKHLCVRYNATGSSSSKPFSYGLRKAIYLATDAGLSPRFYPDFLIYVFKFITRLLASQIKKLLLLF